MVDDSDDDDDDGAGITGGCMGYEASEDVESGGRLLLVAPNIKLSVRLEEVAQLEEELMR